MGRQVAQAELSKEDGILTGKVANGFGAAVHVDAMGRLVSPHCNPFVS